MITCKPKRTQWELVILIVSFIAAAITVAGKFELFSVGSLVISSTSTPQDIFMIVMGILLAVIAVMFIRKTK